MPPERRRRRKYRRKKRTWAITRFWKRMRIEYGNAFYNALFFIFLTLLALFIMFYFMGWLEGIGLKYEPEPLDPPK